MLCERQKIDHNQNRFLTPLARRDRVCSHESRVNRCGDKIILEVTERGFPDKLALDTLNGINGRVKVAIDDLGTGNAFIKFHKG